MLHQSKKLIIFDLDGTLVDSAHMVLSILNRLRAELHLKPIKLFEIKEALSVGGKTLIMRALSVSERSSRKWLTRFRLEYKDAVTPKTLIYKDVRELMNYLLQKRYLLAVCSNKPEYLVKKTLCDTDLLKYFSIIIGGNSNSPPKPNPERILTCIQKMNVELDQAIFIGDSSLDQEASFNAGIEFIFFRGGYDDGVNKNYLLNSFKSHRELFDLF